MGFQKKTRQWQDVVFDDRGFCRNDCDDITLVLISNAVVDGVIDDVSVSEDSLEDVSLAVFFSRRRW